MGGIAKIPTMPTPPPIIQKARALRQSMTDAERLLWARLRGKRFAGYKFRRQAVIGGYVADFCCKSQMLIVEADGGGHSEDADSPYQQRRTAELQARGYRIVRFWNNDILQNTDAVLERILRILEKADQ